MNDEEEKAIRTLENAINESRKSQGLSVFRKRALRGGDQKISVKDIERGVSDLLITVSRRFNLSGLRTLSKDESRRKKELTETISRLSVEKLFAEISSVFPSRAFNSDSEKHNWLQTYLEAEIKKVIPWYGHTWDPNSTEHKLLWCIYCNRQKMFHGKQATSKDYNYCEHCQTHSMEPYRPN